MAQPVRYLFDQAFNLDRSGKPERETVDAEEVAAKLAAARKEAFEAGRAQGRAEAAAQAESHLATSIDTLMREACALTNASDEATRTLEQAAIELAVLSARKLARGLVTEDPLAELTRVLRESLGDLRGVPHVIVRVNADLADMLDQRVTMLAAEAGISGRIIVMGEPEIVPGDGRIEWADGGVVRRIAQIEREIDDALERYFGKCRGTEDDANDGHDHAKDDGDAPVTETEV
ncbi:MAG: flagellar assembly protein FliH [Pseudomonadota bacterium]